MLRSLIRRTYRLEEAIRSAFRTVSAADVERAASSVLLSWHDVPQNLGNTKILKNENK